MSSLKNRNYKIKIDKSKVKYFVDFGADSEYFGELFKIKNIRKMITPDMK